MNKKNIFEKRRIEVEKWTVFYRFVNFLEWIISIMAIIFLFVQKGQYQLPAIATLAVLVIIDCGFSLKKSFKYKQIA